MLTIRIYNTVNGGHHDFYRFRRDLGPDEYWFEWTMDNIWCSPRVTKDVAEELTTKFTTGERILTYSLLPELVVTDVWHAESPRAPGWFRVFVRGTIYCGSETEPARWEIVGAYQK